MLVFNSHLFPFFFFPTLASIRLTSTLQDLHLATKSSLITSRPTHTTSVSVNVWNPSVHCFLGSSQILGKNIIWNYLLKNWFIFLLINCVYANWCLSFMFEFSCGNKWPKRYTLLIKYVVSMISGWFWR